jgi:transcriptional regulator with XRE-family HTH domain
MNQLERIRRVVFGVTQAAMAEIAGVQQSTVSRWEKGLRAPTQRQLQRIRNEAIRRGLPWDDRWFFDPVPVLQHEAAA